MGRGLVFLAVGHFLLRSASSSREVKQQPRRLAAIAAWILFAHWVDACWLVMPFSATPA